MTLNEQKLEIIARITRLNQTKHINPILKFLDKHAPETALDAKPEAQPKPSAKNTRKAAEPREAPNDQELTPAENVSKPKQDNEPRQLDFMGKY